MPLSEFLRMARGKLESSQQKPCHAGFSSRCDDDLLELVWENGEIVMQGQSSRVTRSPALASNNPRTHNAAITSRIGKQSEVESVLDDLSPVVPSGDLDLSQDDEMVPWLNYHVDDALPHYHTEFLPEISGVTGNGMPTQNSFVSTENKSSGDQNGNVWEGSSSSARLLGSWPPHQGQISNPSLVSGVSDIVSNNTSKNMVNDSMSTNTDRQNIGISSNSSNLLNFSHFSRPSTVVKSYLPTSDGLSTEKIQVKGKGLTVGVSNPVKSRLIDQLNTTQKGFDFHGHSAALESSKSLPAERTENLCRESSTKNEKPLIPGNNICDTTKGVPDGERSIEPLVASSSVGSGQSGDRASCEQTHNSKRKFCDINESEFHGDDIETESAGAKNTTAGRGGVGSKRSRAAEVHNLSERRRRDRINEKMRALQELIPNCNKADKASMLDEAIEYLKTLQLQVQMMSMGAGLFMPPMMFPSGIHPAHLPHFPSMGVGMGLGMGFGMGMADLNGGSSAYPMFPAPPMQGAHFPSPMGGPVNFQRMPGPMYAHLSQGLPNSLPLAPLAPVTGRPPVTSASVSRIGSHGELHGTSQALNSENPVANKNPQLMHNAQASSSINHTSNQLQATNEVLDKSTAIQENKQATDVPGSAALTPTQATDNSKVAGCDEQTN